MVVDDIQFLSILKGKRVRLTLKNASYLGIIQRINPNKTIILADVVGSNNGGRYPGSKMFFGHEIINVEFTNEGNYTNKNVGEKEREDFLTVQRFQPYRRRAVGLDDDKDEEHINFLVIDEFHDKFGSAVMHIKKQHVIGVGADGVEIYRHGRLCWLQIATKQKVYLFDILILGARAFKNGLAMILQSKSILKVIHDCRTIAGCVSSQFGVNITNVFDTQVADVMCFYSETGGLLPNRVSTLQEVISLHLKVPSSQLLSLQMKTELTQEKEMWCKRPCPLPLLKVMALSVVHLQPLRLVLLDTLMTDYMLLVDAYLKNSNFEPDELKHISMESVLELPKELRQLEKIRCDRQEWAAEQFPVTEQGLLDRFNPRMSKSSAEESQPDHSKPDQQRSEASSASVCASREHTDFLMDTNDGALAGKLPSLVLPGIGRGMFLQPPPAQSPGESAANTASGNNEASEAPKSLSQSFRSFRK